MFKTIAKQHVAVKQHQTVMREIGSRNETCTFQLLKTKTFGFLAWDGHQAHVSCFDS
jgi:hypothetical protein